MSSQPEIDQNLKLVLDSNTDKNVQFFATGSVNYLYYDEECPKKPEPPKPDEKIENPPEPPKQDEQIEQPPEPPKIDPNFDPNFQYILDTNPVAPIQYFAAGSVVNFYYS